MFKKFVPFIIFGIFLISSQSTEENIDNLVNDTDDIPEDDKNSVKPGFKSKFNNFINRNVRNLKNFTKKVKDDIKNNTHRLLVKINKIVGSEKKALADENKNSNLSDTKVNSNKIEDINIVLDAKNVVHGVVNKVKNTFDSVKNSTQNVIETVKHKTQSHGKKVIDDIIDTTSKIQNKIINKGSLIISKKPEDKLQSNINNYFMIILIAYSFVGFASYLSYLIIRYQKIENMSSFDVDDENNPLLSNTSSFPMNDTDSCNEDDY